MSLLGCSTLPSVVAEDAGNESYMRQVVPILHGRKIRGYQEVKLLSDLAALTSREITIRALMQQADYVGHWTEVFVDDLRVHREGDRAQNICYGPPLRAGAAMGALIAWADGVRVDIAEGVKIRPLNGERFLPLKPGQQLRYGDLLAVPAGGKLRFKGELAEVATPKSGLPKNMLNKMMFISITGEEAVSKAVETARAEVKLPLDRIKRVQRGWASRGEGGTPVSYEQYKSYKYPEWELTGKRESDQKGR